MSPIRNENGANVWDELPDDTYLVVGKTTDGKRFRQVHQRWLFAAGINLYDGRKYLVRGGKRYLVARVTP